jgi:hypothetical protein
MESQMIMKSPQSQGKMRENWSIITEFWKGKENFLIRERRNSICDWERRAAFIEYMLYIRLYLSYFH